jgi:hypothetical protein
VVVVTNSKGQKKLKLIDADNLTPFGKPREICSPGQNISHEDYGRFRKKENIPCNNLTDKEGFDKLINYV